jgi:hypothetical protein
MANAWAMRPLAPAGITAVAGDGSDPMNVANDYLGVVWRSTNTASNKSLTVDLGASPGPVDAALFFGCTAAPAATLLAVEAADDSGFTVNYFFSGWLTFLAGATFLPHGRGVGYWESTGAALTRRYWKFTFDTSGTAVMTVGRLAMGQKVQLARNFDFGGGWGVRDLGSLDFSPAAVLLRRQAAKLRTIGLTFSRAYKDEVETKIQPLLQLVAGQHPIALVTDPAASSLRQTRCWFGPLIGDLGNVWRNAAAWEWRANMVDLVPIPKDVF